MKVLVAALIVILPTVAASQARKQTVEGVRNFTIIDAKAACAGATDVAAIPRVAALGYKSIINLRLDTEGGAAIPDSRAAAEKAGLKYLHLPLNTSAPDFAVADAFIKAVTDASYQPVFFHCASANRAGALWMAKRMLVDRWDEARAREEALFLGVTNAGLEKFALDYVAARIK